MNALRYPIHRIASTPRLGLLTATAIFAAAAMIATPRIVHAQPSDQQHMAPQPGAHHARPAKAATSMPGSVEERIVQLHAELKITPDEEKQWNDVAQAMRDNAASIDKLIAAKT